MAASAILRATATYAGPTNPCAQSGAVCAGTVRVDVRQLLAVANSGANSVTLYTSGQSFPLTTIQNGVTDPQALVFDAAGDLFVANLPGSVTEYVPPYNQAPIAIANGVNHPQSLAVDVHGNLFVANGSGSNTVTVYSPPYSGAPSATISSNVNDPVSLAFDSTGDLFIVNAAANTVTEYAPPYAGAPTTISKGLNTPSSLALDAHGNLFVANLTSTPNSVVEFAPPFTNASTPVATITNGINEQGSIAVLSANVFVPNQGANTVTEYAAPYTGSPTTIVGGQSQPIALAIDAAGTLYVANYGNNTRHRVFGAVRRGLVDDDLNRRDGSARTCALACHERRRGRTALGALRVRQAARTHKASPSSVTSAPHPSRSSPRSSAVESGVET